MSDTGPTQMSACSFNNHPGMLSGPLALQGFNFDSYKNKQICSLLQQTTDETLPLRLCLKKACKALLNFFPRNSALDETGVEK